MPPFLGNVKRFVSADINVNSPMLNRKMSVREKVLNNFSSVSNRFAQNISVSFASDCYDTLGISYFELNRVSNELARYFSKLFGEKPQYIGISLSDYFLLPCVILAVWKSKNCFVGIGTQYNREDTLNFLNFLGVTYCITDTDKNEYGGKNISRFVIHQRKFFVWRRHTDGDMTCSEHICYGIMTSGSTGDPKILHVPWSCIFPNAVELSEEFQVTELDCIFLACPYSFDPFFIEFFMALLNGCTLMIVSNAIKLCASDLLKTLFNGMENDSSNSSCSSCFNPENEKYFQINVQKVRKKLVTILQMTPSLFRRWSDTEIKEIILSIHTPLRVLILGGEKFPKEILNLKHPSNATRIYNIYGITEISCWAFLNEVTSAINSPDMEIPIGRPLNNIVYKISENGEFEIGSQERICLLNNEEMSTFENVVYRKTGDIVNFSKGEIYFVGRTSQVVKKYGMKINLSKIEEAFVKENELIRQCICIYDEESSKLGLFFVSATTGPKGINYKLVTFEEFHQNSCKIPSCVSKSAEKPDYLIEITETPLNSHGKCDRQQLLQFLKSTYESQWHKLDVIASFRKLWVEVLGITDVNFSSTSFMELGGNSVLGLDMINKLEDMGFNVPQNFVAELLGGKSYDTCLTCLALAQENPEIPRKKIKFDAEFFDVSLFEVWKFDLGKCVDAPAIIFPYEGEERLVIGSHSSKLSCLKPDSGCEMWTTFLGDRIESAFTPTKDGSRGFVGSYDNCVYCIATSDGSVVWKFKTRDIVKSTPCLSTDEKIIYVASYDKHLYFLSSSDGKPQKSVKLSNGGVRCPGIVSDFLNKFFIGTLDGTCVAIDQETHELTWKTTLETPIFAAPCLITNKPEILFSEVLGNVHCVNALTGDKMWVFKAGGNIYSSPTARVVNGMHSITFGCHDAHLYCLQYEKEPELKWKQQLDSSVFAKPLIVSDFSSVCAITTKGFVYLCDIFVGAIKTRLQLKGEIFSSAVYSKNRLFVGCRDNNVYCLEISKVTKEPS